MKQIYLVFISFFFLNFIIAQQNPPPTTYGSNAGSQGYRSSFFGTYAGQSNLNAGDNNVFVGHGAGTDNTIGRNNTFLGVHAGRHNLTSNDNVFIGSLSGEFNTTGNGNSFIGRKAGQSNQSGNYNIAIGHEAFAFNSTGVSNISIGYRAGYLNNASSNIFIGTNAGSTNGTGSKNVFLGEYAGRYNSSGNNNVFIGNLAGQNNTSSDNVFIGSEAGESNTSGNQNTFIGFQSGEDNTTGKRNTFLGRTSGINNINGSYNTFLGFKSGFHNSNGHYNTFVGYHAGVYNKSTRNTFLGDKSGENNVNGGSNTFIGALAGRENIDGEFNTLIGHNSDVDSGANSYTNSMALGYLSVIDGSNQIQLGNNNITNIFASVNLTTTSDERYKKNITPITEGLNFILALNPVNYNYDMSLINRDSYKRIKATSVDGKGDLELKKFMDAAEQKSKITYNGFLAQEVYDASISTGFEFSGITVPENENGKFGLKYSEFVVPLIAAVKEQQLIIDSNLDNIEELRLKNEKLEQQLYDLVERMKSLEGDLSANASISKELGIIHSISPNPSFNSIEVRFTAVDFENASLIITDQSGNKIYNLNILNSGETTESIELNDSSYGIHYCLLSLNGDIQDTKQFLRFKK